ncbi:MAG: hypothetical protein Q8L47_04065 [bacterium]|nr:hypothetical protein [bacterium]
MIIKLLKKKARENFVLGFFLLSLIILIVSAIVTYLYFPSISGNNIIIYLDLYRDRSVSGSVRDIYQFISLGFVLICTNLLISRELSSKQTILASFVSVVSVILSILILIAIGGIIHIN